jgi:hypothetical protein
MLMHLLLLMYTDIECVDAYRFIRNVNKHEQLSPRDKIELVQVIQEATPECPWDAND